MLAAPDLFFFPFLKCYTCLLLRIGWYDKGGQTQEQTTDWTMVSNKVYSSQVSVVSGRISESSEGEVLWLHEEVNLQMVQGALFTSGGKSLHDKKKKKKNSKN